MNNETHTIAFMQTNLTNYHTANGESIARIVCAPYAIQIIDFLFFFSFLFVLHTQYALTSVGWSAFGSHKSSHLDVKRCCKLLSSTSPDVNRTICKIFNRIIVIHKHPIFLAIFVFAFQYAQHSLLDYTFVLQMSRLVATC